MKNTILNSKTVLMGTTLLAAGFLGCKNDIAGPNVADPIRNYTFQVRTSSSNPIVGAAAVIRLSGAIFQGFTDQQGSVSIPVPDNVTLPEFVIVTIDHGSFMPAAVTVPGVRNCTVSRSVSCTPSPSQTLVKEVRLHHLGDNHYNGDPNSQLQLPSEGIRMTFQFSLSSIPTLMPYLRAYGRGIQNNTKIKINGTQVSTLDNSPTKGDLGFYNGLLNGKASSILRKGINTLELETGYDASLKDYDDIEFCSLLLYYK